ncbi:hypothetical protein NPIL_134141 [Nephila pilipes]|uniref:Uncharacterized protein n=1 Tax=Nephila pilipes TaxID=299642 RepID=A0A8X6Q5V6_NEPPI|nr:hypothetical protein NPIL_134141 [Nephila pilipes]
MFRVAGLLCCYKKRLSAGRSNIPLRRDERERNHCAVEIQANVFYRRTKSLPILQRFVILNRLCDPYLSCKFVPLVGNPPVYATHSTFRNS